MERLKMMKENLMNCVQSQIAGNLEHADAKELGEAVDMIKDLSEAIYYCTITEAMEQKDKQQPTNTYYYTERYLPNREDWDWPDYRDMDKGIGRMYYDGRTGGSSGRMGSANGINNGGNGAGNNGGTAYYRHDPRLQESYIPYMPEMMRDYREGKSPMTRKMYMEGKDMHKDKASQMKDLEKYMQELSQDVTEMIQGASPEEKQLLQTKISALSKMIV